MLQSSPVLSPSVAHQPHPRDRLTWRKIFRKLAQFPSTQFTPKSSFLELQKIHSLHPLVKWHAHNPETWHRANLPPSTPHHPLESSFEIARKCGALSEKGIYRAYPTLDTHFLSLSRQLSGVGGISKWAKKKNNFTLFSKKPKIFSYFSAASLSVAFSTHRRSTARMKKLLEASYAEGWRSGKSSRVRVCWCAVRFFS